MANEKRLIDANAFFEIQQKRCWGEPIVGTCTQDNVYLRDELAKAPTVEAVEVPCKIGQTVYVINGLWVSNYVVTHFWYDGCFFKFKAINEEYAYECRDFSFFDERIGKTVFFTYEQAETALKKMYGGNEDANLR